MWSGPCITFVFSAPTRFCFATARSVSTATAAMLMMRRVLGTSWKAVDVYIVLTEFGRRKLVEGDLSADSIAIKPNFAYPDRATAREQAMLCSLGDFPRNKGWRPSWRSHVDPLAGVAQMGYPHCSPFHRP